jgi:hypothetical protein
VELDDPPPRPAQVGRQLVVVDGVGVGHIEDRPAGVLQPLAEVGLVGVDEEVAIEVVDLGGGVASDEHRARLGPTHSPRALATALRGDEIVQEQHARERCRHPRQTPGAGLALALGRQQLGAGGGCARVLLERFQQRRRRAGVHLGVLVEQQAVAAARRLEQRRVVLGLAGAAVERDRAHVVRALLDRGERSVVGAVVEHEDLVRDAGGVGPLDRRQAGEQVLAPVGVDDAVGEVDFAQDDLPAARSSTPRSRSASRSRSNSRSASWRALTP